MAPAQERKPAPWSPNWRTAFWAFVGIIAEPLAYLLIIGIAVGLVKLMHFVHAL